MTHLREGDEIELLEILQEFVMVIALDGLREDGAEHDHGEENQFALRRASRTC